MAYAPVETLPPFIAERMQLAIEAATEGKPLRDIAQAMGCNYSYFCHVKRTHALFGKALREAQEDGWMLRAEGLLSIHTDNPRTDPQILKMLSDNTKWLLSRQFRAVFGDSIDVTYSEKPSVTDAIEAAKARAITVSVRSITDCTPDEVNPFE